MKKLDFIFSIIGILMLGLFGVLFMISPKKQYSPLEDRILQSEFQFPIFSEKNINELETYYQDQFLYRPLFLELGVLCKKKIGIAEQNQVYLGKNGYLLKQTKPLKQPEKLIATMNEFHKNHNALNLSLLLLPSHVTVNPELVDKKIPLFDEQKEIKSIYHNITFNTIDVFETLKKGSSDYEMYYHLDSNLTSYGAYYVYQTVAHLNDLKPLTFSDFDIKEVSDSFSGNLVKKSYLFSLPKDRIVIFEPKKKPLLEIQYSYKKTDTLYEESFLNSVYSYPYFLGRSEALMTITNQSIEAKELLILKDESANPIIPFLTNHYSKIHVIDTDIYKQSIDEYLKEHQEIKDVIFIYGMYYLNEF